MQEAVEFLKTRAAGRRPTVAVVLGSGLGGFGADLSEAIEIPYYGIPGWPLSTAAGHAGKLILGRAGATQVAVMSGRAHLYEGYSPADVTFGVRVLGRLGVRTFIITNAAGGIHPSYARGGLVLITDHLNLQGSNPLVGPNDDSLGPRFPDLSEAYSGDLRRLAREVAGELGIPLGEGVYAAVLGPSYETPAEIRYLRAIGADLVGMSTAPEVIAANHMGCRVLAISCVTNAAAGAAPHKLTHAEVLETAQAAQGTLARLLKALLPRIEG